MSKQEKSLYITVPNLEIETDIERKSFETGNKRKEMRKEIMERNRNLHVALPED